MPSVFKPLTWSFNWIKGRYFEPPQQPCALVACTRTQSRWQRFSSSASGTFLQGSFYCRPQCLEAALVGRLARLQDVAPSALPPNRIPLGLLMVARGKLTHLEVRAALEAQRRARYGKIGDWIEKLGFATEHEVTSALALQWGCPVTRSIAPSTVSSIGGSPGNIPLSILEAFQMLPLNYATSTNTLYVACGERVDHAALYAIEKVLGCRTQPCVFSRKNIARQLESMRQLPRPSDAEFGPMSELAEMASIAASYTARLNPDQVRLSRIGRFIWLRLDVRSKTRAHTTNLVFRLATDVRPIPFTRPFLDLQTAKTPRST